MPVRIVESLDALKELTGTEIAATGWFEVTQDRISQFAEATEDRQWIHLNSARAQRESPYAGTIAHGFLTLSLLSHLLHEAFEIRNVVMGVNYGLNRVRFPAPVRAGSSIRGRFTLDSVTDVSNAKQVVLSVVVEDKTQEKPCCVAEWILRYYT
jgi:acyl dehydratase